jgi:hypothetical protein
VQSCSAVSRRRPPGGYSIVLGTDVLQLDDSVDDDRGSRGQGEPSMGTAGVMRIGREIVEGLAATHPKMAGPRRREGYQSNRIGFSKVENKLRRRLHTMGIL